MPNKKSCIGKKNKIWAEISNLDFRHVTFRTFSISYEVFSFIAKILLKHPQPFSSHSCSSWAKIIHLKWSVHKHIFSWRSTNKCRHLTVRMAHHFFSYYLHLLMFKEVHDSCIRPGVRASSICPISGFISGFSTTGILSRCSL